MKPLLLTTILSLSLLATQSARAADYHVSSDGRFGCADKDYFKKIVTIAAQGDQAAFKKTLLSGLSGGVCTLFEDGEPVYLVKAGFASVKIRRAGDTKEYWTNRETIK
ncbi:MAG: hypothetical protein R3E13_05795 [Alphaproteobacteria bacterium]